MEILWEDDIDYEMRRNIVIMKVKMRYIELDLVVPTSHESSFTGSSNTRQIDEALSTLSAEEKRKTTRKFRKQARKALGKNKFGKISRPRKRSAVYTAIWKNAWADLEIKSDEDLIGNLAAFV